MIKTNGSSALPSANLFYAVLGYRVWHHNIITTESPGWVDGKVGLLEWARSASAFQGCARRQRLMGGIEFANDH